jgi:uncharacterized membrane protein
VTNQMVRDIVSLRTNLTTTERAVSVVLGLGLAAAAAQPRPNKLLSLAALVAGAALAIRGATGHCSMKAAIRHA